MGYSVYITRRPQCFGAGEQIALEEWRAYVARDPELQFDDSLGEALAVWSGPSKHEIPWLAWTQGNIESKYPDPPLLEKMCEIAEAINARVQGEEGELYGRNGRVESPHGPGLADRLRNWWSRIVSRGASPVDAAVLPFVVGDRVLSIVGPWHGTVTDIDLRTEHGLGRVTVRRDDGALVYCAAVAHGLLPEPKDAASGT
jgi:hypothetical protein